MLLQDALQWQIPPALTVAAQCSVEACAVSQCRLPVNAATKAICITFCLERMGAGQSSCARVLTAAFDGSSARSESVGKKAARSSVLFWTQSKQRGLIDANIQTSGVTSYGFNSSLIVTNESAPEWNAVLVLSSLLFYPVENSPEIVSKQIALSLSVTERCSLPMW